jgi:tRNA (guanine-N7-)-methyltransferase
MGTSEYRDKDHIKSYVKRATRMSQHQRRSYEQLKEHYCVPFSPEPADPHRFFPDHAAPVVAEIGFGMGRATAELAVNTPGTNYLGIEVYTPGVGKLLSLIHQNELSNVRIIHHDAILVLEQMLPAGSLDAIHLFFPDPWPKKRHHKRRIVRPALTALMRSRLKKGGYLYMVTDWQDYAEHALAVLSETPGLHNPNEGFAPPQPWRPTTAFEAKGKKSGRPIWELSFLAS